MPRDGIEVVGCIVVDEAEGYLDRLGVQEIAAGRQWDARHPAAGGREGAEAAWEELDVFSRYDIGRVAGAHLEIERTDEFIVDGAVARSRCRCLCERPGSNRRASSAAGRGVTAPAATAASAAAP